MFQAHTLLLEEAVVVPMLVQQVLVVQVVEVLVEPQ
jgi:hypothetical protein